MPRFEIQIWKCEECREVCENPVRDGYGEGHCPDCEGLLHYERNRPAGWVSIAVYARHSQYGGPEEGGWTFDAGYLHIPQVNKTLVTSDMAKAERMFREMDNEISSKDYAVRYWCEKMPPENYPEVKPLFC